MVKRIEPYIERVDDLPVLFGLLQQMGIQAILDDIIVPHGNWDGLTHGWVITIWLTLKFCTKMAGDQVIHEEP